MLGIYENEHDDTINQSILDPQTNSSKNCIL
jgi:hypothetical protein